MLYCTRLAETLMKRYPDPDSYPYASWSYPQGFLLWGFIRLYEKTGDKTYRDYVMRYCEEHVGDDGTVRGFTGVSLDDMMSASVLVWAYTQTHLPKYKLACEQVRRSFDDYPRNPDGGFWHSRDREGEMWVDGLFMGQMFLVRYGAYVDGADRDACFAEAIRQLNIVFDRCEKDGSGLLYHAYSARPGTPWANVVTGKSHEIWSEGLGWYAMILADVLAIIPKEFPGWQSVQRQLEKLLASLAIVQDPCSGLWYQVVDKIHSPGNWHDSSGSAMFLYTFRKAELLGLCETSYPDVIRRGFEGLKTKCLTDLEGNLNVYDACDGVCVQLDYETYVRYAKNVNAKEAVAAALWALAAVELEAV